MLASGKHSSILFLQWLKKKVSPVICGSPGDVEVLENNRCDQDEGMLFVVLLLKCTTELFSGVRLENCRLTSSSSPPPSCHGKLEIFSLFL